MLEWADELRALVRELKDIDVYFAMRVANWSRAQGFEFAAGHDFLGGDFYGGRDEQLDVCKFMLNLSERRPIEFMATVTSNLTAHESLKSQEEHDLLAFAAIAHSVDVSDYASAKPNGLPLLSFAFAPIALTVEIQHLDRPARLGARHGEDRRNIDLVRRA